MGGLTDDPGPGDAAFEVAEPGEGVFVVEDRGFAAGGAPRFRGDLVGGGGEWGGGIGVEEAPQAGAGARRVGGDGQARLRRVLKGVQVLTPQSQPT